MICRLGEIAVASKGKKPRVLSTNKTSELSVPYINIKAFEQGIFDEYTNGDKCNICDDGDLLMVWDGARAGYTGKAKKGAIGSTLMKIEPKNRNLHKEYLYYFLLSLYRKLNTNPRGVGIPHVEPSLLWDSQLELPDIKLQQAIVSKIEELFSELDKGIENLQLAQQQLKTCRQSVLKTSIPQSKLYPIESIIMKLDQGWSPKCENTPSTDPNEWAVIKTTAVQHGCFIEFENKKLPHNLIPREQHELSAGDILITRAGPRVRVGVCCLVRHVKPKLINCDKVYRIKVHKEAILPEYFELLMNTPNILDVIDKMKTGINDSGVNLTQRGFLQIQIPVPDMKLQREIVEGVESRLSVADKMEECINQSLQQADALRQSILKKAFEGKLI